MSIWLDFVTTQRYCFKMIRYAIYLYVVASLAAVNAISFEPQKGWGMIVNLYAHQFLNYSHKQFTL